MSSPSIIGVDRCRNQWLAAIVGAESNQTSVAWRLGKTFAAVIDETPWAIGVDIPIGLMESGLRQADVSGRAALPGKARARLFLTPPRLVLQRSTNQPNEEIQRLSRELSGQGVSRQALALAPAIFDVERTLVDSPTLAALTWEVHPELSFATLSGQPALDPKTSATGVAQRVTELNTAFDLDVLAVLSTAPSGAPVDDCLDALAAAWSAKRCLTRVARSYPEPPFPVDARGLRMAIMV